MTRSDVSAPCSCRSSGSVLETRRSYASVSPCANPGPYSIGASAFRKISPGADACGKIGRTTPPDREFEWTTRITTRSSGSRRPRVPTRSRRPIVGWHASTTLTSARNPMRPSGCPRSMRPTRCCPTPSGVPPTTSWVMPASSSREASSRRRAGRAPRGHQALADSAPIGAMASRTVPATAASSRSCSVVARPSGVAASRTTCGVPTSTPPFT